MLAGALHSSLIS